MSRDILSKSATADETVPNSGNNISFSADRLAPDSERVPQQHTDGSASATATVSAKTSNKSDDNCAVQTGAPHTRLSGTAVQSGLLQCDDDDDVDEKARDRMALARVQKAQKDRLALQKEAVAFVRANGNRLADITCALEDPARFLATSRAARASVADTVDSANSVPLKRAASAMPDRRSNSGVGGYSGNDIDNGSSTIKRSRLSERATILTIQTLTKCALDRFGRPDLRVNNSNIMASLGSVSQALKDLMSATEQALAASSDTGAGGLTNATVAVENSSSVSAGAGSSVGAVQGGGGGVSRAGPSAGQSAVSSSSTVVGNGSGSGSRAVAHQAPVARQAPVAHQAPVARSGILEPVTLDSTQDQTELAILFNERRKERERQGLDNFQCGCALGRHRSCANKWLAYSRQTIADLERAQSQGSLIKRLFRSLHSLRHVPKLRLFISTRAQTNFCADEHRQRANFWREFEGNTDRCFAEWRAGRAIAQECDDASKWTDKLLVSGAADLGDETAGDEICNAVNAAVDAFHRGRINGGLLRATLIDILVRTNGLVRALRLSANGNDRAAIGLVALMGEIVILIRDGLLIRDEL